MHFFVVDTYHSIVGVFFMMKAFQQPYTTGAEQRCFLRKMPWVTSSVCQLSQVYVWVGCEQWWQSIDQPAHIIDSDPLQILIHSNPRLVKNGSRRLLRPSAKFFSLETISSIKCQLGIDAASI